MRFFVFLCFVWLCGCVSPPKEIQWGERIDFETTGYCPCVLCCKQFADGLTATNRDAYEAGVAVDPRFIPLGSHVDIPGYNRGSNGNGSWIRVDDTGVEGYHIDVRFKTHDEALQWGRKWLSVRVWPKGRKPK